MSLVGQNLIPSFKGSLKSAVIHDQSSQLLDTSVRLAALWEGHGQDYWQIRRLGEKLGSLAGAEWTCRSGIASGCACGVQIELGSR